MPELGARYQKISESVERNETVLRREAIYLLKRENRNNLLDLVTGTFSPRKQTQDVK